MRGDVPTELNSYQQKLRHGPVMGINFRLQGASLNFLPKSDLGHEPTSAAR